ncbi:hypothetical protein B0H14DRAFT_2629334 [Mycena olivaceomarginata]|nr:hypothetical protein B0H14DRAFT_2629334 [Mycena olivaceomarginata]
MYPENMFHAFGDALRLALCVGVALHVRRRREGLENGGGGIEHFDDCVYERSRGGVRLIRSARLHFNAFMKEDNRESEKVGGADLIAARHEARSARHKICLVAQTGGTRNAVCAPASAAEKTAISVDQYQRNKEAKPIRSKGWPSEFIALVRTVATQPIVPRLPARDDCICSTTIEDEHPDELTPGDGNKLPAIRDTKFQIAEQLTPSQFPNLGAGKP